MFNSVKSVGQTQEYIINSSDFQLLCPFFKLVLPVKVSAQVEEAFVTLTGSCEGVVHSTGGVPEKQ